MKVNIGTIWTDGYRKDFRVINVVELQGKIWVHYIKETTGQEYSCYQESFVSRFSEIKNRH